MKGIGSISLPFALFLAISALSIIVGAVRITPAPAPLVINNWPMLARENDALLLHVRQKYGFPTAQIENLEHDPIDAFGLQSQLLEHPDIKKLVLLHSDVNNRHVRLAMPVASGHDTQQGNKAVAFFSMEPLRHGRANMYLGGYSKLSNVAGIEKVLRNVQVVQTPFPSSGSILSKNEALQLLQQWSRGPV